MGRNPPRCVTHNPTLSFAAVGGRDIGVQRQQTRIDLGRRTSHLLRLRHTLRRGAEEDRRGGVTREVPEDDWDGNGRIALTSSR
ncbi:hypothetical protein QJS04_geneDACA022605 [Acorus gramineus]|uniref:Uncharacterized protein n=1 Tax=Acorus gramineus TaxID=55184 RepID=A0AAV9BT54_ACOGR|nr:hypothetical protein QJS04_geneDACA022605 [Acorus gramineus]